MSSVQEALEALYHRKESIVPMLDEAGFADMDGLRLLTVGLEIDVEELMNFSYSYVGFVHRLATAENSALSKASARTVLMAIFVDGFIAGSLYHESLS